MEDNSNLVYIPEEDVVISFEVTEDKPFNKCFECRSFRNGCSGPNLSVMSIARVCEFLQMARIFLGYSYQEVADGTGVSLATVKRTLTGKISDPSFFTISAIAKFLLGDPNGKYPCAIPDITPETENVQKLNDALRDLERALNDNQDYRHILDGIHNSYHAEMQEIRDDAKAKIDYLLAQVDRLQRDNDNLWAENNRKSKIVDMIVEKQKALLTEKNK